MLNKGLDQGCPLKEVKLRSSHVWWNQECEDLKRKVKRLEHRIFKSGRPNDAQWGELRGVLKEYKKVIKKAKSNSWQKFVEETNGMKEMSRLKRILTKENTSEGIKLVKRKDGSLTTSLEETVKVLIEEHFPDSKRRMIEEEGAQNNTKNLGDIMWITEDRVKAAIGEFKPHKAAGPDGLKPIVLQEF